MLTIEIPDYGTLRLEHLVLDFNGTLACRGELQDGVRDGLVELADHLRIHVLTADTFQAARPALAGIPCELSVLPIEDQAGGKLAFVQGLGVERTVCIGNGRNDRKMLREATLGIAVVLREGAAVEALQAADVVCTSIDDALRLLREPLALVATLRS